MKLLSSILIALVLCSCSLPKTISRTNDCGSWVFGIPRASQYDKAYFDQSSIDLNNQNVQECLRTHYSQGFKIALPRDPSSQREPTSSQVPTQAKRQLIKNEQLVQVSLGDGWEEASSPSPMYLFFMKNRIRNAAMAISVFEQNPLIVWSDTRDALYRRHAEELEEFHSNGFLERQIGGKDAAVLTYSGTHIPSRAPLKFIATHYRSGKKNIYLTLWCFDSDYEVNRDEFEKIIESVRLEL